MPARSTARLLLVAVLGLAVVLVWNVTRARTDERRMELPGAGSAAPESGSEERGLEQELDASPRVVAAPVDGESEADPPRPRLVVVVSSAGTNSPERPLPGATIHAADTEAPLGTTDGAGRLDVELPAGTEGVRLYAEALGHARASTTAYVHDGVARAELTLSQVAVLVGRVRHADGSPAADARVAAIGEDEAQGLEAPEGPRRQGAGTPDTSTDDQGRFRLEVPAGAWRLASAAMYGTGRLWGWTEVVEAVEGAETRVEDLALPPVPSSRVLRGRVLDARRAPVAGARIDYELDPTKKGIARGSRRVDESGTFTIVGEEGEAYDLRASTDLPGLAEALARGVVGGSEVELVLEPAPILEVAVLTADGPPTRELRWWLGRIDEQGDAAPMRYGTTPAEARGVFATTWPEGAEVLQVLGFAGDLDERVALPPRPSAGESARVEVRLREGLRLEGRILGTARGLARPLVRARRLTDAEPPGDPDAWPRRGTPATRMAADGSFLLGLREPGTYWIGVTGELREPLVAGPFEVLEPPGILDLELALQRPDADVGDE